MPAGGDLHQDRVERCPDCGGATVRWRQGRYNDDFDWCPACRSAIQCACDRCLAYRALRWL